MNRLNCHIDKCFQSVCTRRSLPTRLHVISLCLAQQILVSCATTTTFDTISKHNQQHQIMVHRSQLPKLDVGAQPEEVWQSLQTYLRERHSNSDLKVAFRQDAVKAQAAQVIHRAVWVDIREPYRSISQTRNVRALHLLVCLFPRCLFRESRPLRRAGHHHQNQEHFRRV